jgi:hypothetical protein
MDAEHPSSGSEPPGDESRPVEGLRLRSLPSCGEPEFPVAHPYFEIVYGPAIGPAAVAVNRNLARHLAAAGGPVTVCPIQVALEVGLRSSHSEPLGRKSHLARALDRLAHHRLIQRLDDNLLGVVVTVPPMPDRWFAHLPDSARLSHDRILAEHLRALGGSSGEPTGSPQRTARGRPGAQPGSRSLTDDE